MTRDEARRRGYEVAQSLGIAIGDGAPGLGDFLAEAVIQTAPYGGFPRALNGLGIISQICDAGPQAGLRTRPRCGRRPAPRRCR
jgi:hypothetical protein